ncbi:hypothetical protein [Pseudorhodoferax sp. Leaf265]|uniref:hypothetical protein n=1 Tax=Pseudorhodoferax sp. Leaf265 TaxID=1736315 RepID=UPI0012E89EEF|nr:hypothetical protein [Pseudorhodoferax sp. Leaf265]
MLTNREWLRRFADRLMQRSDLDDDAAVDVASTAWPAHQSRNPETAADAEIASWGGND